VAKTASLVVPIRSVRGLWFANQVLVEFVELPGRAAVPD
jgi:hypothetical protein